MAPNVLKALTILPKTTVRRSEVDQEYLKPYSKSEKGHISESDQQSHIPQPYTSCHEKLPMDISQRTHPTTEMSICGSYSYTLQ